MSIIAKKICLLGDFSVGKTSLVRRFVEGKFSDNYLSTVGVKISRKAIELPQEAKFKQFHLLIWDIEGNTKFKPITSNYLQGASGAIIVGDLTRPDSLEHIKDHLQLFKAIAPLSCVVLALNKSDLVSEDKLRSLSQMYNFESDRHLATYLTSAKTGKEVEAIFQRLSLHLYEQHVEDSLQKNGE